MNLENLNLVELNAQEVVVIDGGDAIDGYDSWTTMSDNAGTEFIAWTGGLVSLVLGGAGYGVASGISGAIGWLSY